MIESQFSDMMLDLVTSSNRIENDISDERNNHMICLVKKHDELKKFISFYCDLKFVLDDRKIDENLYQKFLDCSKFFEKDGLFSTKFPD